MHDMFDTWIVIILIVILVFMAICMAYRRELIEGLSHILGPPKSRFEAARVDELDIIYAGNGETRGQGRARGKLRLKNLEKYPRSRSEAEVVRYLEEITGDAFPTAYPKWLIWKGKHLELDGFNGKIALEFSGPLHTKWTPGFEQYIDYFERVVRDVVKRRLCKKHGVKLIVVDASLPARHWRNYILSRLFDIGVITSRPAVYLDEQVAIPYRNEQLEAELGITNEYDIANRL